MTEWSIIVVVMYNNITILQICSIMFSSVLKSLPYFFRRCETCGRDETAFLIQDTDITPRCWRCAGPRADCLRIYRYSYQPAMAVRDAVYFVSREVIDTIASYVHNGTRIVLLMPKVAVHKTTSFSSAPCGNSACHASVACNKKFCSIMCALHATQEGAADSEDESFVEHLRRDIVRRVHSRVQSRVQSRVSSRQCAREARYTGTKRKGVPRRAPCV